MGPLTRWLPPRCLFCAAPGSDRIAICRGCRGDLPWLGNACSRCATPLPATAPGLAELTVCGACLWRPPPFARIRVSLAYASPVDWLVRRLKFRGDLAAGRLLGELVAADAAAELAGADAVVPVPLHPRRLVERGFNQASEIAWPLARALGAPLVRRALTRTAATVPQMDLPAHRRGINVRGSFAAGRGHPGRDVVLVDDVVTTASTVAEAARRLIGAGAERVTVVAAARA